MKTTDLTKKKVKIKNKNIEYSLRRRKGVRSLRLAIYPNGNFVVTAPRWYPLYVINRFLEEKSEWISDKLSGINFGQILEKKKVEKEKYQAGKKNAKELVRDKLEFFNQHYNFFYNRISVKNQKTCWGSASRNKNLNFNYKIIDLPEDLQDYIIVHELCHLKELNHGQDFWQLVSQTIPNHKELRKKLKIKII